jgi:hypothetical protein
LTKGSRRQYYPSCENPTQDGSWLESPAKLNWRLRPTASVGAGIPFSIDLQRRNDCHQELTMRFARRVFLAAGIYGLLLVVPNFFLERLLGEQFPPEINHPEFFYGFLGAVLAWQVMYLLIGSDPPRFRPAMLLTAAAKLGFVASAVILYSLGRSAGTLVLLAMPDAVFAALFVVAWTRTSDWQPPDSAAG